MKSIYKPMSPNAPAVRSWAFAAAFAIAGIMGCAGALSAATIVPSLVPTEGNPYHAAQGRVFGNVVRAQLTPQEEQATIVFEVALNLRNPDQLQERINRGDVLKPAEIESYLPSADDYYAVKAWLISQGFTISFESNLRHAIFAQGTVQQASRAFMTAFGRVATSDGEFSSALTEPSLPDALAPSVHTVLGLQTHLRRHHGKTVLRPALVPAGYVDPATISGHYLAPASDTGASQTIAIIGDNIPKSSDLTLFWNTCVIPQTISDYTVVNVSGGPGSDMTDQDELSMDVECSSSIASGASIRLYAAPAGLTDVTENLCYSQILADLPSNPNLHQTSESFGGPEGFTDASIMLLAAQGVTCFASSGDSGSNPNYLTDEYDSTAALTVSYPASDPNVTGVGCTSLVLNGSGLPIAAETGWSLNDGIPLAASGGGLSAIYGRPAWQVGTGVPAHGNRCVPDVAALAINSDQFRIGLGFLVIINGSDNALAGTSLSSPVWAGFCARINQARAGLSLPPLGALNPKIYPLIGTSSFNDITAGSNGFYSCGVGYDLVTGIGTPSMTRLIAALTQGGGSPTPTPTGTGSPTPTPTGS